MDIILKVAEENFPNLNIGQICDFVP